jgi:hypothetical protein|eukprot:COSAG02_NODE_3808_length_6202_cov_3.138784_1_plen_91_part_00
MRSHHPRWVIIFYYPREVSEEMGPTGILPGATYTTIDHQDSGQDFLQDVLEAYLETDEVNARKAANQKTLTEELKGAGAYPALTHLLQCA